MMRATTEQYSHSMNMTVCQNNIQHQTYQSMYTSYSSVISVNMHKGNFHPLSQPLTTSDIHIHTKEKKRKKAKAKL